MSWFNLFYSPQSKQSMQQSPQERYHSIIQSWQVNNWHLRGFQAYDMQQLHKIMQEDLTTQKITENNLNIMIMDLISQHTNMEVQTVLAKIRQKLIKDLILADIHYKIFTSCYENASVNKIIENIETVNQYIQKQKSSQQIIQIIQNNLKKFEYIIDDLEDGNCGYRCILISAYMNNLQTSSNHFQNLLKNNFIRLFTKYDVTFQNQAISNKAIIANKILNYLLSVFEKIKHAESKENVRAIVNQERTFDYFMIMFLRYMLADYIANHTTIEEKEDIAAINRNQIQKVLQWKDELDELETIYLAKAINIQIQTIQETAHNKSTINTELPSPATDAYISFTDNPGHYKILIKKPASASSNIYGKNYNL